MLDARPARVCLIEDDADTAEAARIVLRDAGYEVAWHGDGQEALQSLRAQQADLILLDLQMPDMNGWQFRVAQRADDALSDIPVVIMTGDTSPQAAAIHAASSLSKPFSGAALIATVQRVLRETEHRRLATSLEETGRLAVLATLANGVGHEVNNPLAAAMANLELMEASLPGLCAELAALENRRDPTADAAAIARANASIVLMQENVRESRAGLERVRLVVRNLQNLCHGAPTRIEAPRPAPMLEAKPAIPRLWIVDDEPAMTRVIGRMLGGSYTVVLNEGPTDVLLRLHAGERFEVMLCDVMMPEMSGVDLASRINDEWPALARRIVFMSGGALSPRMHAFVTAPGRRFIAKPFTMEELRAITASAASAELRKAL